MNQFIRHCLSGLMLTALSCCASTAENETGWLPILPDQIPTGIWKSDGYGYLLDMRHRPFTLYDVTETTCLKAPEPFDSFSDFYGAAAINQDATIIQAWDSRMGHRYQYQIAETLPIRCHESSLEDDHITSFDYLSAYFRDHHIFFELHNIDWEKRTQEFRSRVRPDMSDRHFFLLISEMLSVTKDSHVELEAQIDEQEMRFDAGDSSGTGRLDHYVSKHFKNEDLENPSRRAFYEDYVQSNLLSQILSDQAQTSPSRRFVYGMVDKEIGYLAIMHMGPHGPNQGESAEEAIQEQMNQAVNWFEEKGAKSLILDLSINTGGYETVALIIANYLSTEEIFLYSKQAKDTEALIPPTRITSQPAQNSFDGNIYLLTSNATISGGEALVLSLRSFPYVTHFGERTRGALSDKLLKPLPNGWTVTMSNELILDHEGKSWEGIGIPPEIPLTVFESENPLATHLQAVKTVQAFALRSSQD